MLPRFLKTMGFVLFLNLLGLWYTPLPVQGAEPVIPSDQILRDIRNLSQPSFKGRQAGTAGGQVSARFVAERFQTLGLGAMLSPKKEEPFSPWFHYTPLSTTQLLPSTNLTLSAQDNEGRIRTHVLRIGSDYLPVLDSPAVHLMAPIVFVGYGIDDPARGSEDFRGINVRNRIVMFLRGKPPTYSRWVTHEEKARVAQEKGAVGYITVTGPLLNRYEARKGLGQTPLAIYASPPEKRSLPGVWISGAAMDATLGNLGTSLETLQSIANEPTRKSGHVLPILAQLKWDSHNTPGAMINVLGQIPGQHPFHKREVIIIGAHRDHFGQQGGLLFPGADDNASGTAIMLEAARLLTRSSIKPQRTILFISFDGEERGLLGSKSYVRSPARPLEQTVAMINLDHVGVGNGSFTVGVTRMEKKTVQQAAQQAGLIDKVNHYGYFPGGDHVPFYQAGIPTITIVSAGIHPHFHQASDTADTLNPEILQTATQFVFNLLTTLANSTDN